MADMSPRDRELERERKKGNKKQGLLDGMRLDAYDKPTSSTMVDVEDSMMGGPQLGGHQDNSSTNHDNYSGDGNSLSLGGNSSSAKPVWGPDGDLQSMMWC